MERSLLDSLTEADIKEIIDENEGHTKYARLEGYYEGDHDILRHRKKDSTAPNNRLVNNMAKYITDTATGYFIGKPVVYSSQNDAYLKALQDEIRPERVLVEYNGMWMLDSLYGNLPEGWAVAQEFLFCDATSFLSYNANMRQLMVDKLKSAELVVLNRYNDSMDRMEMHRIIRAISRRCDIAYEYTDGKVVYDDIEDPLPFDLDAPVVEIEDRDFAIWYRDMSEEPKKYDGKTIEVKCRCLVRKNVPKGCFIAGRHIMTCCVQDIQFAGIICVWDRADEIRNDEWAIITARLDYKFHRAYGRKGPVFTVQSVQEVEKPEEPVATFY